MPLSDRTTRADGSILDAARVTPPRPPFAAARWAIMTATIVGAAWFAHAQSWRDPAVGAVSACSACVILPVTAMAFLLVRTWRNILLVGWVWLLIWLTAIGQRRWLEAEAIRAFREDRYSFRFSGTRFDLVDGMPGPNSSEAEYQSIPGAVSVHVRRDDSGYSAQLRAND